MLKMRAVLASYTLCAGLLLVACTSMDRKDAELVAQSCVSEDCLAPILIDLAIPEEKKYFIVRNAIQNGLIIKDASSRLRQQYATLATFVGQYEEAKAYFPFPQLSIDPAGSGYVFASPANQTIRALARSTRAVFINEAHASPETRAAAHSLVNDLREEGYRYLAIEALTSMPEAREGACADAAIFDADLAPRGYARAKTGFYTREPVFGEVIRAAIGAGYTIVAYESPDPKIDTIEGREQRQAENLACILKGDPNAKLVVLAGFSHIKEGIDPKLPGGWMAARFKSLTGVDPLTIDTTSLLRVPSSEFVFKQSDEDKSPSQGYTLMDASGRLFGSENYDLILKLAETAGRDSEGVSWLSIDGLRRRVNVTTAACGQARPCLVKAFPIGEEAGIAADSCVMEEIRDRCQLFLSSGKYRVQYLNADLEALVTQLIDVPK